jgi:hypothetical protein
MNQMLKQIHHLRDRDLRRLSQAIDAEMQRRINAAQLAVVSDEPNAAQGDEDSPAILYMRLAQFQGQDGPRRAA